MTTTAAAPAKPIHKPTTYAAIGLVLAAVVIVAGNYHVAPGENGGTGPAVSTAVLCVLLTAVMVGVVVRRARRLERTTLILGILAVISLAAFWSGITPVLAATSFAVAARGTNLGKKAAVGQALGVAAVLLAVGWTSGHASHAVLRMPRTRHGDHRQTPSWTSAHAALRSRFCGS
jgi:hypothetical protein